MLRYIARQPILDVDGNTFGYELLYRARPEGFARISNAEDASRLVLDDLITLGMDKLTRGRHVFLNCTQGLLTERLVKLLPAENVVLEILETIVPDQDLVQSCADLKTSGYTLALDDFVANENTIPLIDFVDFIKIDFQALSRNECRAFVRRFGGRARFVAEKIETQAEYADARDMGCCLFQGFFLPSRRCSRCGTYPPCTPTTCACWRQPASRISTSTKWKPSSSLTPPSATSCCVS